MYRQSIIIFGIVVPILVAALFIGCTVFVKAKITSSFNNKSQHYAGHEGRRIEAIEVEARLAQQQGSFKRWQELVDQETFSVVTTNLRAIGKELPAEEFQQTAFERLSQSTGFGSITAQDSSGLRFNFRGTYRTLQKAFLELETRMPNLQLQELRITPSTSTEAPLLDMQVTYTAWEN